MAIEVDQIYLSMTSPETGEFLTANVYMVDGVYEADGVTYRLCGRGDGRGVEIQRLIGRALRQAIDLKALGERTITLDCDVLEADGGTRTASITGAMVALTCAADRLVREKKLPISPIVHQVAAISAGLARRTWWTKKALTVSSVREM